MSGGGAEGEVRGKAGEGDALPHLSAGLHGDENPDQTKDHCAWQHHGTFWHPCCFLLLKGGLWIHLPTGEGHHVRLQAPNFVKFEDVQSVNFARYVAQ